MLLLLRLCCCSFCSEEDDDDDEDENGGGEGEGELVNCVSSLPQPIFTFFCLVDLSCLLLDKDEEGSLVAAAAAWTLLLQPKSSFSSLCSLLRVVGVVDAVSSSSLVKIVEVAVVVLAVEEVTVSTSVSLC